MPDGSVIRGRTERGILQRATPSQDADGEAGTRVRPETGREIGSGSGRGIGTVQFERFGFVRVEIVGERVEAFFTQK